jgi:hypothetical protein
LSLDWRVTMFTAALMVLTTMLFGVAPAVRATRVTPNDALKDRLAGRTGVRSGRVGVFDSLIVVQVALSLAAVVSAGLFVRTFEQLVRVRLGFDRDGILSRRGDTQNIPPDSRDVLFTGWRGRRSPCLASPRPAARSIPLAGLRNDLVMSPRGMVAPSMPNVSTEPIS